MRQRNQAFFERFGARRAETPVGTQPRISGHVALGSSELTKLATLGVAIRDVRTDALLATAKIEADGSFISAALPAETRGKSVRISIVGGGDDNNHAAGAKPSTFEIPNSGDAFVAMSAGDHAAEQPSASPDVLTPATFAAMATEQAAFRDAFRVARADIAAAEPTQVPDWGSATKLVESLPKRQFGSSTLHVSASELDQYDRAVVFTRPAAGVANPSVTRTAKVLLTTAQSATLGSSPTLCEAVLGGAQLRGFERHDRLVNRLARRLRLGGISLPAPPTTSDSDPPTNVDDDTMSVEVLAESVEKAVLHRTRAAIGDLTTTDPAEPGTAADLLRLRGIAEKLEMSAGTANVSAAREVHTLRVAFHQDSTTVLDPGLVDLVSTLHDLRARLAKDRQIAVADPPTDPTQREFLRYLTEVKQTLRVSATEAVPKSVRVEFPRIDAHDWARLSDETRDVVATAALRNIDRGKADSRESLRGRTQ